MHILTEPGSWSNSLTCTSSWAHGSRPPLLLLLETWKRRSSSNGRVRLPAVHHNLMRSLLPYHVVADIACWLDASSMYIRLGEVADISTRRRPRGYEHARHLFAMWLSSPHSALHVPQDRRRRGRIFSAMYPWSPHSVGEVFSPRPSL